MKRLISNSSFGYLLGRWFALYLKTQNAWSKIGYFLGGWLRSICRNLSDGAKGIDKMCYLLYILAQRLTRISLKPTGKICRMKHPWASWIQAKI